MTISITIPGATFTNFVERVLLPYIDEATGYYLFGSDAASSTENRALDAVVNATVVGTPAYSTGYATFTHLNGLDLGFVGEVPYTRIVVAKYVSGLAAMMGHWTGEATDRITLNSGGLQSWPNGTANGSVSISTEDLAGFVFCAESWNGTGPAIPYAHDGTSLQTPSYNPDVARTTAPVNNLRVGAQSYDGVWQGAAAVTFDRVLSAVELLEIYDFMKVFLPSRSVTLV